MAEQFRFLRSPHVFIAHSSGARIEPGPRCAHDQAAVFIALFGHRHHDTSEQRLDVVLPRCGLAALLGAIQAQIVHREGHAALEEFLQEVAGHTSNSLTALEQLHAEHRDCCEAGFRTGGSEHTCGRDT